MRKESFAIKGDFCHNLRSNDLYKKAENRNGLMQIND